MKKEEDEKKEEPIISHVSDYLTSRIDECKKNRNKALEVGNTALAREWATAIQELVSVEKEVHTQTTEKCKTYNPNS